MSLISQKLKAFLHIRLNLIMLWWAPLYSEASCRNSDLNYATFCSILYTLKRVQYIYIYIYFRNIFQAFEKNVLKFFFRKKNNLKVDFFLVICFPGMRNREFSLCHRVLIVDIEKCRITLSWIENTAPDRWSVYWECVVSLLFHNTSSYSIFP